jgi:hypothetical protein
VSTSPATPLAKAPDAIWPSGSPPGYERRRPEQGTLHKVVRENLQTLLSAAQEHVTFTDEGLVAIQLKKPFRDGTVSVEMDPLSLVSRLAAAVHPPRFHSIRYGGILAPHAKWRPFVIPPPTPEMAAPPPTEDASHSLPSPRTRTHDRPPIAAATSPGTCCYPGQQARRAFVLLTV